MKHNFNNGTNKWLFCFCKRWGVVGRGKSKCAIY